MKTHLTLNTFRKLDRAEEAVIRAMMPKTSERDTEPLALRGAIENSLKTSRTLTFKLSEVVR